METKLEGIWESQCLTACYLGMNYTKSYTEQDQHAAFH